MSTGKIITGIAAGLAAGAILGILFAPDKGTETRKKIAQKGTDIKDGIKSKFSSLLEGVAEEYEHVKDKADRMVDMGKEKMASLKTDTRESLS